MTVTTLLQFSVYFIWHPLENFLSHSCLLPGSLNQTLLFIDFCKVALFRHCYWSCYRSLPSTPFTPCCKCLPIAPLINLTLPACRGQTLKDWDLRKAWPSLRVQNAEGLQVAKTWTMSLAKNLAQWQCNFKTIIISIFLVV